MAMHHALSIKPSKFEINGKDMRNTLYGPQKKYNHTVYEYQTAAARKMYEKLVLPTDQVGEFQIGMIVGPTGCGKSGIINLLPYFLDAGKVCILTPSQDISAQLERSFGHGEWRKKCFIKRCGLVTDDELLDTVLEPVLVVKSPTDIEKMRDLAIVTAHRFMTTSSTSIFHFDKVVVENVERFFNRFDLLIIDEAHHYPASTWEKIVETFKQKVDDGKKRKKIVFLTATPNRKINGLTKNIMEEFPDWKDNTFTIKEEDCIGKTIRRCNFHEPAHPYTDKDLIQDLEELFEKNRSLSGQKTKQQALILVTQKDEANSLSKALNALKSEHKFALPITSDSRKNLEKFSEGKCTVGITCGIGTEGYDNPNITLCVILRRLQSPVFFSQFIGRCKRMNREEKTKDKYEGWVLSYPEFEQKKLYADSKSLYIAEYDPVEGDTVPDDAVGPDPVRPPPVGENSAVQDAMEEG